MSGTKLKVKWKSALVEIIYIFMGVTLAVWFQNWNDNRKEQILVEKLSRALHTENQLNLVSLPQTMDKNSSVIRSARALMSLMGEDYQSKDRELVDSLMFRFMLSPRFNANQEAIEEITDSGKLEIIKDDSLRRYIIQWNLLKKRSESVESMNREQYHAQILPYLQQNFSILAMDNKYAKFDDPLPQSAFAVDNRKILGDFRFENLLEMQYYSMNYQQEFHDQLLSLMKKLDSHLKKTLK